jgi:putative tryptophan/tyrosine transport system substrate-binding protein
MRKPILRVALGAMHLALCSSAEAQQLAKIPQVGLVVADRETTSARELQQGLRELGYIEGKNIRFEYRYTHRNLDRIPSLVSELVQLKVDVLVLSNFRAIRAAKQTTQTIPVVMVTTQDPVETGIIDSLARPGGNITGLTRLTRDLSGRPKDIAGWNSLGREARLRGIWVRYCA